MTTAASNERVKSFHNPDATHVIATKGSVFFGLADFNAASLYMISFIAGFGYKLRRKY